MKNLSKGDGKVTIGLDIGDNYSYAYALDSSGELLEEGRIRTRPEALQKRFSAMEPARVAMETGTHSLPGDWNQGDVALRSQHLPGQETRLRCLAVYPDNRGYADPLPDRGDNRNILP